MKLRSGQQSAKAEADNEKHERRQKKAQRQKVMRLNSALLEASCAFTLAIKEGPDYVCMLQS